MACVATKHGQASLRFERRRLQDKEQARLRGFHGVRSSGTYVDRQILNARSPSLETVPREVAEMRNTILSGELEALRLRSFTALRCQF